MPLSPWDERIRLIDVNGDEKVSSQKTTTARKASSLPWFQRVSTAKEIVFSDVHIPEEIGAPVIIMAKAFPAPDGKASAVSVAEELSAQAQQMRGYVEELAAVVGGSAGVSTAAPEHKPALPRPAGLRGDHSSRETACKKGGAPSKSLIPFGEDEKGDFKEF